MKMRVCFRIFSHVNVHPVLGCCADKPHLYIVSKFAPYGSLFSILHEGTGIVIDTQQALTFALNIANGMAFLHSLREKIPGVRLNSKHVVVSNTLHI